MSENRNHNSRNYRNDRGFRHDNGFQKKRSSAILPPPAIIQAYEEISEGAADRLLEMAEIEQNHRHDWEAAYLRSYTRSHRIGQLTGIAFLGALIYSVIHLASTGAETTAITVAVAGFLTMSLSGVVAYKTRKFERKPRKFVDKNQSQHSRQNEEELEEEVEKELV